MSLDPRTPVLVGAGQVTNRPTPGEALAGRDEPTTLMALALEEAAADAGGGAARRLLERADSLRVMLPLSWRYANPAALVAERLGVAPAELAVSSIGGNSPQTIASQTALAIAAGRVDVALLTGADCIYTRVAARRDPARPNLPWAVQAAATPEPVRLGDDRAPVTEVEEVAGLDRPNTVFPLFANALRHAAGRSLEDDRRHVAELWSRFSAVAAGNPYAWTRTARSAEEIATVGPDNRMVAFPYPKLCMANDRVDQAAAFIMCSYESAQAAGVPAERMVFPVSGADAHDHWFLTHRDDLCSSPAIRLAGGRALALAGCGIDDVGVIDLYSCFPCAVQIAAAELKLPLDDDDRPLTVTGGLGFAGGPGNNYVSHAIATVARRLRAGGGTALVTGLGWYVTKHATGIWAADPPAAGFRWESVQAEVDALPQRAPATGDETDLTVETYVVVVDRDGSPSHGTLALRTGDGRRGWAAVTDEGALGALMTEEGCGRRARLHPDGRAEIR